MGVTVPTPSGAALSTASRSGSSAAPRRPFSSGATGQVPPKASKMVLLAAR